MKKLLRNRGVLLEKGGFQIVSSLFLKKSMFSLLLEYFFSLVDIHAVINRSILSCGLLFTRK